jgi:glyoxylase-like metal-dependent hydrolase (beta-lactamase superfamily II)
MNRRLLLAAAGAALVGKNLVTHAASPVKVGRYTFAGPGTVNTWWIETPRSVIVIDVQRDLAHASQALAAVRAIGKPVSAVFVTHGHPDHYAGLGLFKQAWPGLVAYASPVTRSTLEGDHYGFNKMLQGMWPGNFPNPVVGPDRVIADNETLVIDGVRIVTREFGRSDANSMTVLYLPDGGHLFTGDIVLAGMHGFFYEGASGEWLASLDRLAVQFPRARQLHPGHGEPGAPGTLIAQQRAYIESARAIAAGHIAALGSGDAAQTRTVADLKQRFPKLGNPVGLPNMLELSTQGLFKELAAAHLQPVF